MRRLEVAVAAMLVCGLPAGCATSALEMAPERPDRPWTPVTTAAKRRATPTIHRQRSAAWTGTRISVSVAVVPCICRQNELAGRVIPSPGSATSDIRMPDAKRCKGVRPRVLAH